MYEAKEQNISLVIYFLGANNDVSAGARKNEREKVFP